MSALWKTLGFATLTLVPRVGRLRKIVVRETRYDTLAVRSYESAHSEFPIVLLHGLTREGSDDRRFVQFCRMFAAVGMRVYAPTLQGLRMLDPTLGDLVSVSSFVKTLAMEQKSQVGLIGVSFGGTYALLAAAIREVTETIRFVAAIGPFYSLDDVVDHAFAQRFVKHPSPEQIYGFLALNWKYRNMLPLNAEQNEVFEKLMADTSCDGGFTPEESTFVREIMQLSIQGDIYHEWKKRLPDIEPVSIKDNPTLDSLKAPVFLLHAKNDALIPADQSARIEVALAKLHKPVLRHVGLFGDHVGFSLRNDIGLARFFYRLMLLTETRANGKSDVLSAAGVSVT